MGHARDCAHLRSWKPRHVGNRSQVVSRLRRVLMRAAAFVTASGHTLRVGDLYADAFPWDCPATALEAWYVDDPEGLFRALLSRQERTPMLRDEPVRTSADGTLDLDRFIRERPTPFAEATATRQAIDKLNRETTARIRAMRPGVSFSVLD